MIEIICALIGGVFTIFGVYISTKLRQRKDPLPFDLDRNDNINTALSYTLEKLGADRCYVHQFHNGDHYYSGNSQQKFSCTYEIVEEGISCEAPSSQNHRVSNYNYFIKDLVKNDGFCYGKVNDIEDSTLKDKLKKQGVESIGCVPIKLLNGRIIGVLGVDFVKNKKQVCGEGMSLLRMQSKIIAGYLSKT